MTTVGILHPGEMGAALGEALAQNGHAALWASDGRSPATTRRAEAAGLADVGSMARLLEASEVVIAICPPHAALDVARSVAGFRGTYVDANAIAPATAEAVCATVQDAGATYVDGAIIGPPPQTVGTTRLYLSGARAADVAALYAGSCAEPVALDGPVTAASALKMSYAAWTKGAMALMLSSRSLARSLGVEDALAAEFARSQPDTVQLALKAAHMAAHRGWRFVGEMEEIAATMTAMGLPPGFHDAAADLYGRVPRDDALQRDDAGVAAVVSEVLGGPAVTPGGG